jgi:hypothetical protein
MLRSSLIIILLSSGFLSDGFGAEPSGKKGHTCLVLTDRFTLPNGTVISVDYFYWKAERCRQKGSTISFVCEMPATPGPKGQRSTMKVMKKLP